MNPLHPFISIHILHTVLDTFFCGTDNENLLNNQELPKLMIISLILRTSMFTVILKGEIRNQSLLGVKGLTPSSGGEQ